MRTCLIVIFIELYCAGILQAQTGYSIVTGYLFNPNGSPSAQAQLKVISVVKNDSSFVLTPIVLTTDAMGFVSFAAPRLSIVWVSATVLGLIGPGDVAILIPDADSAMLSVLAQSAKPPVFGFNLSSGSSPTLALSLEDFGINLKAGAALPQTTVETFDGRSGAVTLTSSDISTALNFMPLDPGTVVGAVNASSATINDARLSSDVVRTSITNAFASPQSFLNGLQVIGGLQVTGSNAPGTSAVAIAKGIGASSGLDLGLDGTGKALRFFYPGISNPRTYFNDSGMLYTNGWAVISGTYQGAGDGFNINPPSPDPFMLGIWSDVGGPAVQVRGSSAPGSYLISGLDQSANYTFSLEANGRLNWGGSTRAAMDTNLYRAGAGSLTTDGSLTVGNAFRIVPRSMAGSPTTGTWESGTIIVDSAGVVYVCVASGSPGLWQSLNPPTGSTGAGSSVRTVGLQIDGGSVAPAITGTRFLCVSTQGVITSSAILCSGT
jgi:hypothetical protein